MPDFSHGTPPWIDPLRQDYLLPRDGKCHDYTDIQFERLLSRHFDPWVMSLAKSEAAFPSNSLMAQATLRRIFDVNSFQTVS